MPGLALSPYVHAVSALLLAVSYLLLQIHAEICAYAGKRFPLSVARLGPTEARIALATFTALLVFWRPPVFAVAGFSLTLIDLAAVAAAGCFVRLFVISTVAEARRLDRLDRARREHR